MKSATRNASNTACGYGCLAHLPDGATLFTTVELKANFLGTAQEGRINVVARPAHLGRPRENDHRRHGHVTRAADGGTIALFRCTQLVIRSGSKA